MCEAGGGWERGAASPVCAHICVLAYEAGMMTAGLPLGLPLCDRLYKSGALSVGGWCVPP